MATHRKKKYLTPVERLGLEGRTRAIGARFPHADIAWVERRARLLNRMAGRDGDGHFYSRGHILRAALAHVMRETERKGTRWLLGQIKNLGGEAAPEAGGPSPEKEGGGSGVTESLDPAVFDRES